MMFLNTTFLVQQWYLYANFLFDNGESKYKYSFEPIQNNIMYVRGCFVTLDGSNVQMIKELNLVHNV
jgi:hypothetical protein